jgi:hypothetical protein
MLPDPDPRGFNEIQAGDAPRAYAGRKALTKSVGCS